MAAETEERRAPSSWIRYAGVAIIIASLLEMGTTLGIGVVFPEALVPGTRDAAIVADIVITYLILAIIGVAALYVRYKDSFGWVGNGGLLLIALGAFIGVATIFITGSAAGNLLNLILVYGGAALLAIGLWRTPTIPRSGALLMALSPIVAAVGIVGFVLSPEGFLGPLAFVALSLVWGAAWLLIGYHLWTEG